jgi:hypothetical protein
MVARGLEVTPRGNLVPGNRVRAAGSVGYTTIPGKEATPRKFRAIVTIEEFQTQGRNGNSAGDRRRLDRPGAMARQPRYGAEGGGARNLDRRRQRTATSFTMNNASRKASRLAHQIARPAKSTGQNRYSSKNPAVPGFFLFVDPLQRKSQPAKFLRARIFTCRNPAV